MAGDWIKMEVTTPDKPEVFLMAEILGIDPDEVVGKLVRVWSWADQHLIDGNAVSVTEMLLDKKAGVTGFASAMIEVNWLIKKGKGLEFVNFDRHNGKSSKKRALTNRRVADVREKKRNSNAECNASGVTLAYTREEKRREEYINTIGASDDTPPAKVSSEYPPEFEKAWALYPKRTGSNPKKQAFSAFKARLKQGFSADEIIEGVKSYSAFCESKNQTGTEFVMQAVRFFGTGLEFQNEWQPEDEEEYSDPLAGVHWI